MGSNLDLFTYLKKHVAERPDHPAFQYLGRGDPEDREAYTFARVWAESALFAGFLSEQGLAPGDRIGILMEDHPSWCVCFLGILSAGCVAVPLDLLHSPATLARLVEHSGCRLVVFSEVQSPKWGEAEKLLSTPVRGSVFGVPGAGSPLAGSAGILPALGPQASSLRISETPPSPSDSAAVTTKPDLAVHPLLARSPDDPLVIIYTSGTTGDPKGVVLTSRNIIGNVIEALKLIRVCPTDHMLSVLPLYHALALIISLVVPLYAGFTVSFLSVLEPQRILKAFRDEGITIFVCVPQFYYLLHRRVLSGVEQSGWMKRFLFRRLLSFSHLLQRLGLRAGRVFFRSVHRPFGPRFRLFGVGGARFDPAVEAMLRDLGFDFLQAYGMTETAAIVTVTPPSGNEKGSVGRPLPQQRVAIDRPNDQGVGEVIVRGDNIMQGYWRNPEATATALVDGWLHTGDSGYMSARGFLHLTGRLKDVIVLSSGKNIYPEEIEHHYAQKCPEIKEICVLGVADETAAESREKLHAVIVPDFDYLRQRQVVNSADMIRFVIENASQELPAYKRVHSYEIRREPLPRTTTRKVRRFQLQQELQNRSATQSPAAAPAENRAPATPAEERLLGLIRNMKKTAVVRREMNLELDLGFDSLERVELLSSVQDSFGGSFSDEQLSAVLTVEDLLELLEDRQAGEGPGQAEGAVSWTEILRKPLRAEDQKRVREVLRPRPVMELILYLTARLLWLPARVFFRLRVSGLDNLPVDYPFLICPNHLSYLDPCFVGVALPWRVVRRQFFLGYTDYFESGLLGIIGRLIKVIPVDPDRGLRQALPMSAEGLKKESVLVVYPEGERSIDGALKTFRKGPAILATELRAPVVPVGIRGTYEVWPRGRNRIRFHPVSVSFGKPLRPLPEESAEAFNARLYEAVDKLISGT